MKIEGLPKQSWEVEEIQERALWIEKHGGCEVTLGFDLKHDKVDLVVKWGPQIESEYNGLTYEKALVLMLGYMGGINVGSTYARRQRNAQC